MAASVSTAGFGMSEVAAMALVGDAAGNETKCTSAIRLEVSEAGWCVVHWCGRGRRLGTNTKLPKGWDWHKTLFPARLIAAHSRF